MPVLPNMTNAVEDYFIRELTQNGRDEVGEERAHKLVKFCEDHRILGWSVSEGPGEGAVDDNEFVYLKNITEMEEFRAFLKPDGRQYLEIELGLVEDKEFIPTGSKVDMLERTVTRYDLATVVRQSTPKVLLQVFEHEMRERGQSFLSEGRSAARQLYLLFADYARALNQHPNSMERQQVRRRFLTAVRDVPAAKGLLLEDSDGDHFATVWELMFGLKPGDPQNVFRRRPMG